ncbi:MAG: 5-methyltetrahydropteroyltriglutamate--homocysteine S-methyltransferase [Alphaproteobacteria bacterium]|nr:5-methyltetrahydropteroyltriglutamate--homocysteine S-methyltransferase [Alphaproteobacteria bacterium]
MVLATTLGYPRVGAQRELKKALESYWKGQSSHDELAKVAATLRAANWKLQQAQGIDAIPSNDFSYYDLVLDASVLFGAVPARYSAFWDGKAATPDLYFAMARGAQTGCGCSSASHDHSDKKDVVAAEMTKWFDTNYHYIVPEFEANQKFFLTSAKPVDEYKEAKALGIETRPVLVGPLTYLLLGKAKDGGDVLDLLDNLLPVYTDIIKQLSAAGAQWIQIDEPFLALDIDGRARGLYQSAFKALVAAAGSTKLFVTTYFDSLRENTDTALALPVAALHIDLVRGEAAQLDAVLAKFPTDKILSVGVVNGRNIWRNDLSASLDLVEKAVAKLGADRVWVAPSCSLLFTPYDLDFETGLDTELKSWLAFSKQKLAEVATLAKGVKDGRAAIADALKHSDAAQQSRRTSKRIHNDAVKKRVAAITKADGTRRSPYKVRKALQQQALNLPAFPTTTIGSFPQTQDVRAARASFKKGDMTEAAYNDFLKEKTKEAVTWQEQIDIDVLVHGEFERNDMVEYFGEQLDGFAFTKNGWVQSYGSRCVKPPVLFGDVSRPQPMTVEWSEYAQSLTDRPMKGMLTGPVTILQWSFVRDDQPRSTTCRQIGLALRDEVTDLEKAGIRVIQIDEPALREGLPLRKADRAAYLDWAVESFRLSASGVADTSQIHTHMCYSEFNDIMQAIADLDADVISIETSRSQMELLEAFTNFKYPNEIGPGVYDIHSPRVPTKTEMVELLDRARRNLQDDQIWVNPDCGLKTRAWPETKAALEAMVAAAKDVRANAKKSAAA